MGLLERERNGRKQGVLVVAAISALLMLLALPYAHWVQIVNADKLFAGFKISKSAAASLHGGYSIFNLLSFVQNSKQGSIGIYAMVLLLVIIAALTLHVIALIRAARGAGEMALLRFFSVAQAAMIFSFAAGAGTLWYVSFANNYFKMPGFSATAFPVLTMILAVVAYIAIKLMERLERKRRKEHGFLEELRRNWVLFLFLVPCFIYFMINNYLPMVGIYFAFTQFNFRDGLFASPFVGFKNFEFLLSADILRLTRNTVLYNIVFIGLGNVLQVVFAIFVSRVTLKWFKKLSQTLIFMPYFVSFVILKVLVYNMFEFDYGLINSYITAAGGNKIDFYNAPSYWPTFITLFYLWKNIGYGMVIYLATIMGINDEYYDAAKVDGANVFQQIRYITLPLLKPTFIILLLYALGGILKGQFELFYQLVGTNGVLYNVTDIFDTYVYRITTTQPLSMGLGAAAGLYQSVFGFIIIVVTNVIIKRRNPEYALF